VALQVHDFAAIEPAEVAPLEGSEPAHRVTIADSVELAAHVDRRTRIPIPLIRNHFSLSIIVEHRHCAFRTSSIQIHPAGALLAIPMSRHARRTAPSGVHTGLALYCNTLRRSASAAASR
jgi:hypothetical protein